MAWTIDHPGNADGALAVFDRRTGGVDVHPGLGGAHLLSDPTTLRLFTFRGDDTIIVIEPGQIRQIVMAAGMPVRYVGPLSADGREWYMARLVVEAGGTSWRPQIVVVDPLTGSVRRLLQPLDPYQAIVGMAVSRDGQRLYVSAEPSTVKVLDAGTGAVLASQSFPPPPLIPEGIGQITLDDVHQRLFVNRWRLIGSAGVSNWSMILDPTTLRSIGGSATITRAMDRARRMTVGLGSGYFRYSGCIGTTVETWGEATTPVSRGVELGGECPSLAMASVPEAPATLTATAAGRRVTLDWTPVPGAPEYQLEAGSAPGLANLLSTPIGTARPFVVDGVPPGTYYVRLRAANEVGPGPASREIIVIVQ